MGRPLKFGWHRAIDVFVEDMRAAGRINSDRSEQSYRATLLVHASDAHTDDARQASRADVKRTLRRWPNPNTAATRHSYLTRFYDWLMEEGERPDNPARQVPRPKRRKPKRYRLTHRETLALLAAAQTQRERWVVNLGLCAGLRREEMRLLQGRHFQRDGFVWVSADIAKGPKERYVPVIEELVPIVEEIRAHVAPAEYVFPSLQFVPTTPVATERVRDRPTDGKVIWRTVKRLAKRAGIEAQIGTHTLRHAHADHMVRARGVRFAQALLGHADISTTQGYLSDLNPQELLQAAVGLSLNNLENPPANPLVETVGIEPTQDSPRAFIGDPEGVSDRWAYQLAGWLDGTLRHAAEVYTPHFDPAGEEPCLGGLG